MWVTALPQAVSLLPRSLMRTCESKKNSSLRAGSSPLKVQPMIGTTRGGLGDTIETADGPMVVTSIWEGQAVTDVYGGDLDAEELYPEMGATMGMSEEEFASFIDSYNELKREAAALETSHHVLGPTEMEIGRLAIRIRQQHPDWTEEQINAEVERLLDPKVRTAEQYADLARREAELFEQALAHSLTLL